MFQAQKIAKFVILPYKNALPIKFNLKLGSNMVGNTQEHDVCINNRQIVKDHCCIDVSENEIELLVLDGPVYYKTEDGQFEQLAKDSVITLNPSSSEYSIRLGKTVEARVQLDNQTQFSQRKNQDQQQQGKRNETPFDLQSKLSNISVKVVESLYNSPKENKYLEQFQIDQNQKFSLQEEEDQIEKQKNDKLQEEKEPKLDYKNYEQELDQQAKNPFLNDEISLNQNHLFKEQENIQIIFPCSQVLQDVNNQITNEQTLETRSIGTPDFNNDNDSKQQNSKKKQTKKKQKTLDYLIVEKKSQQISSPKIKTHSKLKKEVKKESIRMSARRCSRWRYCIAFSGFQPNREEQQFLLLQNVQICLEDYNYNILIMEDLVELRTVKLLIALAKGIPIVSREWLMRSINQYEMLDYNPYLVQFSPNFCKDYQFNYKQYKNRLDKCVQNKKLPLNDINIVAPKRIKYHIEHQELECIIESLGGKVLPNIPDEIDENNTYIFIPKDQADLNGYEKIKKIPIENLFKTALKYKNSL